MRAHLAEAAEVLGLGRNALADIVLVATELVTNALRAGAHELVVSVQPVAGGLQLRVRDDAPGEPARVSTGPADVNGRGLMIVAAIAREWGFDPVPAGGKVVWATLALCARSGK